MASGGDGELSPSACLAAAPADDVTATGDAMGELDRPGVVVVVVGDLVALREVDGL